MSSCCCFLGHFPFWLAGGFNFFGDSLYFFFFFRDVNGDFMVLSIGIFAIGRRTSFEE